MEDQVKRPVTVYVAQGVLLFFGATIFLGVVTMSLLALSTGALLAGIFFVAGFLIFLAPATIAFYGLVKRRRWARWLSFIYIGLIWAAMSWRLGTMMLDRLTGIEVPNAPQPNVAAFLMVILLCGVPFLYKLAFSKDVTAFFALVPVAKTDDAIPPSS